MPIRLFGTITCLDNELTKKCIYVLKLSRVISLSLSHAHTYLKLNDLILREAQVHAIGVLDVEGALVQLRNGIVGIEQYLRLVHFADDEARQGDARNRAHELDGGAVVDEAVAHRELLGLGRVLVVQVDDERAPLIGARVEVVAVDEQVASAHRLRAQPVE